MLSTVSTTAQANPFCLVTNETTSVQGSDLQQAINDATSGDTIDVRGVCFGNFIDGKTLTFRGVSTPARRYPTLDGTNTRTVMTVETGAVVTIKNLVITHGLATTGFGGGIDIEDATAILNGSTRVVHNVASNGGGGINVGNRASLTLNGSVRVNLNSAANGGGVLIAFATMTMNKNSRVNRNDASNSGGGIYNLAGTLTMNGASAIMGNTAAVTGGGIFNDSGGTESGAVAGGNVRNNNPNDIAP